jgi:hypothetical protein
MGLLVALPCLCLAMFLFIAFAPLHILGIPGTVGFFGEHDQSTAHAYEYNGIEQEQLQK